MKRYDDSGVLHGYMVLAARILSDGVRQNDMEFMRSAWFEELRSAVGSYFCDGESCSYITSRPRMKEWG